MIRVNGEFYKDHCIIDDRIVIDIQTDNEELSSLSPDNILKKLYSGELSNETEGLSIKTFKLSSRIDAQNFDIRIQQEYKPSRAILSDDTITNFEDIQEVRDFTKTLKKEYDEFDRKYVHHENTFTEIDIPEDEFKIQIMDSLGVLPTLFNENDLDIGQKVKYSNEGGRIMWPDFVMEDFSIDENPYPRREDIEFYMNELNTYEKRLVRSTNINPLSLIQDIREIRELGNGTVFTKEMYDTIVGTVSAEGRKLSERPSPQNLINLSRTAINQDSANYKYAVETFTKRLTRAPRVLPEIMSALHFIASTADTNTAINRVVDKYIDFYAKTPSGEDKEPRDAGRVFQQSIGKIAQRHSPALFAAAGYINFANISDDVITLMSVYLTPQKAKRFGDAGFFEWYKNHPSATTGDIMEILSSLDYTIDEYSGGHVRTILSEISDDNLKTVFKNENTIDDVLFILGQLRGKQDSLALERKSGGSDFKFENNDIAIRGRNIQATDGKYTILMLSKSDYRNFTAGYDTCCCQHVGGVGEPCVKTLARNPYAAQVVIVKNSQMKDNMWYKGPCLAQAFTWTDEEKSTIVFDNVEFRRTTEENFDHKVKEFSDVIAAWAEAMPYLNVHIGTGFNQGMAGWGKKVSYLATMPENCYYTDYHTDARSVKTNGELQLYPSGVDLDIRIIETPLEPSAYDALTDERLSWLAGANLSLQTKLDFAEKFLTDQTEEVQRQAFEINPACIKYIEHPILEIQNQVAALHKEFVPFIHNPDPSIYNILIQNDPYSIFTIENPTKDAWKAAVKGNGLLLEKCPYSDEDIALEAVKQNGIAIKFVANPSDEIQRAALHQTINAISFIKNPSPESILYAGTTDPSLLQNLNDIPVSTQVRLVEQKPLAYTYLKNPAQAATMAVISRDGMMIRSIKNPTKDMCIAAVKQNGFAIKYIYHPDRDVVTEALKQNRAAGKYVKLPTQEKQNILNEIEHEQEIDRG